jgi:hypothetical protein
MSTLRFQLSVSLDGYAAGPDQSEENVRLAAPRTI